MEQDTRSNKLHGVETKAHNCPGCDSHNWIAQRFCWKCQHDFWAPSDPELLVNDRGALDYSKIGGALGIEDRVIGGDKRKVHAEGFEKRMDRVNTSIRNAKSEHERNRFERIREQTLYRVNKYQNTRYKN